MAKGKRELAQFKQQQKQIMQKKNEIKQRSSTIQQQLIKVNQEIKQSEIKAPITGIIQEMNLRNNAQVVQGGEVIAKIAPLETKLQIKAQVLPQDISKIEKGQLVKTKVSSCPYPDYGVLSGEVIAVSPDVITQDSATDNKKSDIQKKTYYDVIIRPKAMMLTSPAGKECRLKAGMEANTDIITKEETVLQFFLRKARLLVDI